MLLSDCKMLRDMPPAVIETLDATARRRCYDAGEPIIRQYEESDFLCFLLEGCARVSMGDDNSEVYLAEFEPGDHFGELSMIDGGRRSAAVTAVTRCRVAAIDRAVMFAAMHDAPDLCLELMKRLAQLVRTEQTRIANLSAEELLERVLRTLIELAEPMPTNPSRWHIPRLPPHKEIAMLAGTSPGIVAQVIGQLMHKKIVKRENASLILSDFRQIREDVNRLSLTRSSETKRP